MTCARPDSVSTACQVQARPEPEKRGCFPDILHFFFRQNCRALLQSLTLESLENLQVDYFNGQSTYCLEQLKHMTTVSPHNTLMAIFLFLLNVDAKLKSTIWAFEVEQNHRKVERFLMDLKTPFIAEFCINDSITIPMFVDNCWEAYVLA